ncbi:MAG: stalk domain-containing protein [Defluviitaleaceae bacterium]|nr:stalk domain-containing protein [Defluviitaleaceae bacterium]
MKRKLLSLLVVVFALLLGASVAYAQDTMPLEFRIMQLTNAEREAHGLDPLISCDALWLTARSHSEDMATNGFFSHIGSNGSTPQQRVAARGMSYSIWAENIFSGGTTPEAIMQGWMNSADHRANILNPSLTHIGVGVHAQYATQKFGGGTRTYGEIPIVGIPQRFTIQYSANGGTGAPSSHYATVAEDGSISFYLSSTRPTRQGYTFVGWLLGNDSIHFDVDDAGSHIIFAPGWDPPVTYYAQWIPAQDEPFITIGNQQGTFTYGQSGRVTFPITTNLPDGVHYWGAWRAVAYRTGPFPVEQHSARSWPRGMFFGSVTTDPFFTIQNGTGQLALYYVHDYEAAARAGVYAVEFYVDVPDSFAVDYIRSSEIIITILPAQEDSPTPTPAPTPTPEPPQPDPVLDPPSINRPLPLFRGDPTVTDSGILLDFAPVQNNRFGYRIFRATSATADGISISDFPITLNTAFSSTNIITFDPNVRANTVYYYYVREVLEEARFDAATVALTPEVLGEPSERVRVQTPTRLPWGNEEAERGFIMMIIDNPLMNVNNTWEEIDPGVGTSPIIQTGRTMIPIRATVEAMGGTVGWYGAESRVDLAAFGNNVSLWLGSTDILVNNTSDLMDIAPSLVNNRTLLPLRFVAENLGTHIEWIGSQSMVVIVYEKP